MKRNSPIRLSLFLGLLSCFFLSLRIYAQKTISLQKRKEMMATAQDLFYRYQTGLQTDWSDTSEINAFRACFADDAQIYDDIAPDTASRDMERNFRFKQASFRSLSTRSVDQLFNLHTALFSRDTSQSHRLFSEIKNANFNFAPLINGSISVVYAKETSGQTNFGKQKFSNLDTLLMVIDFDKNFSNPKIGKIGRWTPDKPLTHYSMKPKYTWADCQGDPDCDGVVAPYDLCPNLYGLDPDGCPTQGLVPGLTFSGGLFILGQTQLSPLSQDRLGVDAINYSTPSIKPGNNFGLKIGAEYDSWFGKYKNYGFGFGGFYMFSTGTMQLDNNRVQYLRTEGNSQYQQIITVGKATEVVTYNNLSLPFLLKFSSKKNSTKQFNYFVHAGAFLLVAIQGSSKGELENANYEARFGNTPSGQFTEANASRTWEISESRLNEINKNTNEAVLSEPNRTYERRHQAAGYNIGMNKEATNRKDNFFRAGGLGFMARVGFTRRINRKTNILICGEFLYLNNPAKPTVNYNMTESAVNQNYNTFMAATNSMGQWSFGFTAAYQFKLYKKRKK